MIESPLVFEHVTRYFRKTLALDGIDLRLESGRILGLVGRNAAGKTTTLRLAHGLLFPDSGEVLPERCHLCYSQA